MKFVPRIALTAVLVLAVGFTGSFAFAETTSTKQAITKITQVKGSRVIIVTGASDWGAVAGESCTGPDTNILLKPSFFTTEAEFRDKLALIYGAHLTGRDIDAVMKGCGGIGGTGSSGMIKDVSVY